MWARMTVGGLFQPIAVAAGPPALSAPYLEPDACPFECCQFGVWIVRAPGAAFAAPGGTTKVAFHLAPGDSVIGETGLLAVDPLGKVVVRRPIHGLSPGDTVLALHGLSESGYLVWWKGEFHEVEGIWPTIEPSDPWASASDSSVADERFAGEMVEYPVIVWWARVRNPAGEVGWLRLRNRLVHGWWFDTDIEGQDACG